MYNTVKPIKSIDNITKQPILRHIGFKNSQEPLSFNMLVKFIQDNSDLIINPKSFDNSTHEDVITPNSKKLDSTLIPLNINDISELIFLPPNLNNIFKKYLSSMLRLGVVDKYDKIKDFKNVEHLSIISSVLACLIGDFQGKIVTEQAVYVKSIYDIMIKGVYGTMFESFGYKKYKWDKKEVFSNITNLTSNHILLRIISDILHINIFVLDSIEDVLLYIGNEIFVPHKKNIFVLLHPNNIFEPIYFKESKYLQSNSLIIQHLLANPDFVSVINFSPKKTVIDFAVGEENIANYIPKVNVKLSYKDKILNNKLGILQNHDKKTVDTDDLDDALLLLTKSSKKLDANTSEINAFTEGENGIDNIDNDIGELSDIEEAPSVTSDKIEVRVPSDSNKKSSIKYTISELNAKKISEIQDIAKTMSIVITKGVTKNGKDKMLSKADLIILILKKN